jgi:AraC family transcriptional regulator of adaptative response/methylated-DNA-[protein]-cysteine methyltransferase
MPNSTRTAVAYTIAPCPLGYLLVAATDQGICAVHLGDAEAELAALLAEDLPAARIQPDCDALQRWTAVLIAHLSGQQTELDLPLDVAGTEFQRRVWQALQAIPHGSTRTYSQVAAAIGQPTAARAVARACATNPVALVIPCHRVVREDGSLSGYRWGIERKEALLALEARQADLATATDRRDVERRLV